MRLLSLICLAAILMAMSADDTPLPAGSLTNAPSRFWSEEDDWFDISGFLDEPYGFLPLVMPITEPAVGYGAAGGVAFVSKAEEKAEPGFKRPDIAMLGGFGTENGSWGAAVGDMRYWLDDRLQTLAGLVYASVNLDFYGVGDDSLLGQDPLSYNLEPIGGLAQARYRLGQSRVWAGLGYAFASTEVRFDAPPSTPGLPDTQGTSRVGGITPSLTYDTRDNLFTPTRGTYFEANAGLFSQALGGDDEFQRARLILMQYLPLHSRLILEIGRASCRERV